MNNEIRQLLERCLARAKLSIYPLDAKLAEDIEAALAKPVQDPTTRPCRNCGGTGERYTGIAEAPVSICKPCLGTGEIALAAPVQEPILKQAIATAISMLYEGHKDDVLRVFSLAELNHVVEITEPLLPRQVEDIYRQAWDLL
jgi:hypothetical protein